MTRAWLFTVIFMICMLVGTRLLGARADGKPHPVHLMLFWYGTLILGGAAFAEVIKATFFPS